MDADYFAFVVAPILFLAFIFQLLTLNHESLENKHLAKMGKRVMAAGFLVAALRLWFLPIFPLPLGIVSYLLMAVGSLFTNFERILDTCELIKARKYTTENEVHHNGEGT